MLKTTIAPRQIAQEIVKFLSKYIIVDRLILFGSYNNGNSREDSDLDIAVISEDIEKMSVLEKIELFSKVAIIVDSRIELKGFSKSEFLNPEQGSILELIKNEGRVIYQGVGGE